MEDFVSRLKMHMKERDVKQIDICRETGIPTSLMSNYLTDKKSPPPITDGGSVSLLKVTGCVTFWELTARQNATISGIIDTIPLRNS